jgi:hypothetical protein
MASASSVADVEAPSILSVPCVPPLAGHSRPERAVSPPTGYRTPPMGETALPLLDRSGTSPSSRSQALGYAGGDVEGRRLTETHSR